MKVFILENIDEDAVNSFADFVNGVGNDRTIIYIRSNGGNLSMRDILIYGINELAKENDVTLVASGHVFSSALGIFIKTQTKKEILPEAIFMTHRSSYDYTYNANGKPYDEYNRFYIEKNKTKNEESEIDLFEMDEKQKALFLDNQEVYLHHHQIRTALSKM